MRAALLLVSLALAAPAIADDTAGRFTMMPSGQGFLRLDTRSGAVSYCTVTDGAPVCRTGPDERAALEAEIDRLRTAQAPMPPIPAVRLPTDDEADRAIGLMQRFMRGMMGVIRESESGRL